MLVLVLISKCEQIEENDLKTSEHYGEEEKHVCSIYIYTDPYLWSHIYFLEGKKKTRENAGNFFLKKTRENTGKFNLQKNS